MTNLVTKLRDAQNGVVTPVPSPEPEDLFGEAADEIERLWAWQSRASQVLPLIDRHAGTQLAEFVGALLRNEVPPSTGAPEFDRPFEPNALAIVNEQAEDKGLWFVPKYASEDYLQEALRRLHEAVEGKTREECARSAMESTADDLSPCEQLGVNLGLRDHP